MSCPHCKPGKKQGRTALLAKNCCDTQEAPAEQAHVSGSCPHCGSEAKRQRAKKRGARILAVASNATEAPGIHNDVSSYAQADGTRTVVLVGNPNVGKSTLFNRVTGANARVMNSPGTTVQVMAGTWKKLGVKLLDLPGTYSLVPTSPDEEVVRDTISGAPGTLTDPARGGHIDLVLVVLDASSMTRSLYLLAQVAQTGNPVAGVVTMSDVAKVAGQNVDIAGLSAQLNIPLMAVDPRHASDMHVLEEMVEAALRERPRVAGLEPDPHAPGYSAAAADEAWDHLRGQACRENIDARDLLSQTSYGAATAIDLEGGCGHCGEGTCTHEPATADADAAGGERASRTETQAHPFDEAEMDRAATIFAWIDRIEQAVREGSSGEEEQAVKLSPSDRLDRVLLNPVAGTLVFFALLWLLFKVAGDWLGPVQDWFDALFSSTDQTISLASALTWILGAVHFDGTWVESALIGGLATGLGVVASFFPLMFVIYAAFSVLEDSGYMARVAFLGDRLMRKIGLDGRVILPLIIGFGCNVPALAAARTIPSARHRLVTVLITPYTSCAARLTIYLMIAKIFFPGHAGTVVWAMYLLSLFFIVAGAWVLKFFITRDEASSPLLLVLPAYQVPRLFVMAKMTWVRAWAFVTGAGKIIVFMSMVVWLMSAIAMPGSGKSFADEDLPMSESLYGATAQVLEPVFAPTGFGEWHMTGALMTGFVAKETVVSSIVTSYNLDESAAGDAEEGGDNLGSLPALMHESLEKSAGSGLQGLAAVAFMVFVLAYTPCMATVAEQAKVIGGRKAALAVCVQLAVAWLVAVGIFQIGRLFLA